jgi:hypothetical protein
MPSVDVTTSAPRPVRALRSFAALLCVLGLGASACSGAPDARKVDRTAAAADAPSPALDRPASVRLAPLKTRVRADVLVVSPRPLTPQQVARLKTLGRGGTAVLRAGAVTVNGQRRLAVGVDPATFRAYTPQGTAESTPVWQSVARGEAAVAHDHATKLKIKLGGTVTLGGRNTLKMRVGALASSGLADVAVVVSDAVAERLGLPKTTAAVLSAGPGADPGVLAQAVRAVLGPTIRVEPLSPPAGLPMAFLQGGRAARRLGGFSYQVHPDGTVSPEPSWVRDNIRYASVPVIGTVRCHKLMIPQLRAALAEIQRAGLGPKLYSFAGCYVPRFIERNPERSISLHTWGIAVDFNVATNLVGTKGDMDPRIVAIFEKWGFRWGGYWSVPDPMHFELAALIDA